MSTLFFGSTIDSSTILTCLAVIKRSAHFGIEFVLLNRRFENSLPALISLWTVSSVNTCLLEYKVPIWQRAGKFYKNHIPVGVGIAFPESLSHLLPRVIENCCLFEESRHVFLIMSSLWQARSLDLCNTRVHLNFTWYGGLLLHVKRHSATLYDKNRNNNNNCQDWTVRSTRVDWHNLVENRPHPCCYVTNVTYSSFHPFFCEYLVC